MKLPVWRSKETAEAFKVGKIEGCRIFSSEDEEIFADVSEEFLDYYPLNQEGYFVRWDDGTETFYGAKFFEAFFKK